MEEVQEETVKTVEVVEQNQQPNLSQDQINRIVQDRVSRATQKATSEAEAKHKVELEQLRSQIPSMGGVQQPDQNQIAQIAKQAEQKVMESIQKKQQQYEEDQRLKEVTQIAETYMSKLGKGKELFEDFDTVMSDFDPSAFPEVVSLVAGMENVPQVMYELSRNPQKLMTISGLAKKSKSMAQAQLKRLSDSISSNEQAQTAEGTAQPPLNHSRSSVKAGADNGVKSVSDLRKMDFLKG